MTDSKEILTGLQKVTQETSDLRDIPIALAKAVRALDIPLSEKQNAHGVIRKWVNYAQSHNILDTTDPFTIRFHLAQFAQNEFGREMPQTSVLTAPLDDVKVDSTSFADVLSKSTSPDILAEQGVAVIGGAARVALKMKLGLPIETELPLNDVDVIARVSADPSSIAKKYGLDLAGTKVVDAEMSDAINAYMTNVDCTVNQVAVWDGKLHYTKEAEQDLVAGNIRLLCKDDPLFGAEGFVTPSGETYITRAGFYRGLSLLLRGKGDRLVVSRENIEAEKKNIGRYWLVLLFVKVLRMPDEQKRDKAICDWYEVAKEIGSTATDSPEAFFMELLDEFPEMRAYYTNRSTFDAEGQARWIVGKLLGRSLETVLSQTKVPQLPATYTPSSIILPSQSRTHDLTGFHQLLEKVKSGSL